MTRSDKINLPPRCPVCDAPEFVRTMNGRYACGAVFRRSEVTGTVVAADPCPVPSQRAAERIMQIGGA